MKNRGSATIEACLVVPLFLFFMLGMANIAMIFLAETKIHQSLSEAAIYTAQHEYLQRKVSNYKINTIGNTLILKNKFQKILRDDQNVEAIVAHGKKGIIITISPDEKNSKIFIAKASYQINIFLPMIGNFRMMHSNVVKQKYFIGYTKEEVVDTYVYITPNEAVYHKSRNCTHLCLKIKEKNSKYKDNYKACGFCGRRKIDKRIYVTDSSPVFHKVRECSGLKRTIIRVKMSETIGLKPCQRCGN